MLELFNFSVDPKNIGFQGLQEYLASYLLKAEDLATRMRWKLFHATEKLKKKRIHRISYRLINPTKSQMGRISKVILSRVNSEIRSSLDLCQWQSSD